MKEKIAGLIAILTALSLPILAQQELETSDEKKPRQIHDANGDGWCDLWCDLFSEVDLSKPSEDSDGDGITNFQE